MDSPKLVTKTDDVTYYKLNNEINRPIDNAIPLHKDKEAVRAYFLEHVNPNTVFFYTLDEKLNYLIEHDYIEKEFLEKQDYLSGGRDTCCDCSASGAFAELWLWISDHGLGESAYKAGG